MITKHYRDSEGNYIGGFDTVPVGGIEVASLPKHAQAKWDGAKWVEPTLINTKIDQIKLQKYFKNNNYWNFVKRVQRANPDLAEAWADKSQISIDDGFIKIISSGINVSKEIIFSGATLLDTEEVVPSTEAEQLEEAKVLATSLVNAERERRKYADISYKGNNFTLSEWDILMIMSLLQSSRATKKSLPAGNYWRTADNTYVNLGWYDLNRLEDTIRDQIQTSYQWSWEKKELINSALTVAEVEAIDLEITIS